MINLLLRSTIVLALLFGLLFAVSMAVLTYFDLPIIWGAVFALGTLMLQYALGPFIMEWIYKIRWVDVREVDLELAAFIERVCTEKNLPRPKFGIIDDGNPNAFTFGHYPGDARLVVTRGLLERLDGREVRAVVAHELGHIIHWDFVVMTVAAAVPLLLYILYRATLSGGRSRSRSRDKGYAALVGLISYFAYIISHYIVLLLSRVREYYADQFSAQVTNDPNSLASGLVKVAYGLAAAKQTGQDDARSVAAKPFGIFDPAVAQNLALAAAGSGNVSTQGMTEAMRWDLWNPWAFIFELKSTHPLPAKRIKALERMSDAMGIPPGFAFREEQPESYWDEFAIDLLISWLPGIGLVIGGLGGFALMAFTDFTLAASIGIGMLIFGIFWWLNRRFVFRPDFSSRKSVRELVGEVKVSGIRPVACKLNGKIIGRGIPGLFYSEDLVIQDASGFMILDYRQPLRIFDFLFGTFRAEKLIGLDGEAEGWYRRGPTPRLELRRLRLADGQVVTTYAYPFGQFFVYVVMVAGVVLTGLGLAGIL